MITFSEAVGVPASDAYISALYPGGPGRSFSYASFLQAVGLALGAISGAALMQALENRGAAWLFWPLFAALGAVSYSTLLWNVLRSRRRPERAEGASAGTTAAVSPPATSSLRSP